jgi:hypothetical protein
MLHALLLMPVVAEVMAPLQLFLMLLHQPHQLLLLLLLLAAVHCCCHCLPVCCT